jgi:hypothetical protein
MFKSMCRHIFSQSLLDQLDVPTKDFPENS